MITKGTFIHNTLVRQDVPAAIRTGLDTIPAADTIGLIDQNNTVGAFISGPDRAYLDAGRLIAMVAHLGNEEGLENIFFRHCLGKSIDSPVR
jgi:hypothetical protein